MLHYRWCNYEKRKVTNHVNNELYENKNRVKNLFALAVFVIAFVSCGGYGNSAADKVAATYYEETSAISTDDKPRAISSLLEYCRGTKEEGEALSNTMMKKLSGRQYFDNFYYKTKYYLPDSCFIIILPKTAPLATDKAFQSTAVPSIATSASNMPIVTHTKFYWTAII